MRIKMKRFVGILLCFVMMLGLMPGMRLTAYADDSPYAKLKNTVKTFDDKDWYLFGYDTTTVTLLAKECVGASQYNSSGTFVEYGSNPTVKTAVDNYYNNSISPDAKTAVIGNTMFLLTNGEVEALSYSDVMKCSQATGAGNGWWLCSQGSDGCAAFVECFNGNVHPGIPVTETLGVRPALKLNLSSVIFDSDTKTFL